MSPRIGCRTVFLDAGGVIVLPHRGLVADALRRIGIEIDPEAVPRAHYRAVRALDRAGAGTSYAAALFRELGILPGQTAEALAAWERLADRRRSGEILWSEPTPGAPETIAALRRRGFAVVIVTNSDGHAEENLRDCGFAGVPVIDSTLVGAAKPDVRIFEAALALAGALAAPAPALAPPTSSTSVTRCRPTLPAPVPPASPRSTSTPSGLAGRTTTATSDR